MDTTNEHAKQGNETLVMSDALIPDDISLTLLRAMVWCGEQISSEQRHAAWVWIEEHTAQREEMGG